MLLAKIYWIVLPFGYLTYTLKNQMGVQSNIFWLVALFKINTDQFWTFAVPAILFRGLQMIIDELKKK